MNLIKNLTNLKNNINFDDNGLQELSQDTLRALQLTLTEMMMDVIAVCEQEGIEVFLLGGSCLGAVRHKGFIPWDDDIDIGMTRDSYQRFIPVFEKMLSDRYILNAPNYSETVLFRFPKILKKDSYLDCGTTDDPELCKVFMDIFIVDRIPENAVRRKLKGLHCDFLEFISSQVALIEYADEVTRRHYTSYGRASYLVRRIVGRLFSFKKSSFWYSRVDKAVQYRKDSTLWGLPTGSRHYSGEIFSQNVFLPVSYGEFEGSRVPLVHAPDVYMKNLYGDYMQIPPLEKRQKHYVRKLRLSNVDS